MPGEPARCHAIFDLVCDAARALGVAEVEAIIAAAIQRADALRQQRHPSERGGAQRASFGARADRRPHGARLHQPVRRCECIREVVKQAVALARLHCARSRAAAAGRSRARAGPVARWHEATARATPHRSRAKPWPRPFAVVEEAGQTAAGIYSTGRSRLRAAEFARRLRLSPRDHGALLHHRHGRRQLRLGQRQRLLAPPPGPRSHGPQPLPAKRTSRASPSSCRPAAYTVILEPAAVLDLVGQMFGDFSATAISDGRSFLRDRIGQKLFGDNIAIYDDVYHPLQAGAPFDGEGVPRRKLALVDQGVVARCGLLPPGRPRRRRPADRPRLPAAQRARAKRP